VDLLPTLGYPPSPSRLVRLGKALLPTTGPARRAEQRRRTAAERSATTPVERYAAVKAFMSDQSTRWSG
jgi:hypothetical protein